jgi:hypothetical protein
MRGGSFRLGLRDRLAALLAPVLVALALVATAPASASTPSPARQTKRQAEVILLQGPRLLARFSPGLVDSRTRLLRKNTRAVCRGLGRPVHAAFHRLRCVVTFERIRLVVAYTAVGKYGTVLRKIATR